MKATTTEVAQHTSAVRLACRRAGMARTQLYASRSHSCGLAWKQNILLSFWKRINTHRISA